MTRKKVELAYIAKKADRRASFKRRKTGLVKKACELSVLCDVDTCVIIGPYEGKPAELYPDPTTAQQVIRRFKSMPEYDQNKKMENQESFLLKIINKESEKLMKLQKQNRRGELKEIIYQHAKGNFDLESLNNIPDVDLIDLGSLVDQKLQEINNRINTLINPTATNPAWLPPPPLPGAAEVGSSSQPAEGINNPNYGQYFGFNTTATNAAWLPPPPPAAADQAGSSLQPAEGNNNPNYGEDSGFDSERDEDFFPYFSDRDI